MALLTIIIHCIDDFIFTTPKTNGMLERANGIIKNNTILKIKYQNRQHMEKDMMGFLCYYNL